MGHAFSTLVFDLDGTLTDPSLGITRCLNFALEKHGYPAVPDERLVAEIGPPLDETLLKFVSDPASAPIASLVATYRQRYSSVGYAENTVYAQIPGALSELQQSGHRLGVCTSKRYDFAEKILSLFGLRGLFDFVDGGEIGVKKHEQLAHLLAAGTIDRDAVMIGDRYVDIAAGQANGLRSIGVLWGFGSPDEIAEADPTHVAVRVEDLLRIVAAG